MAFKNITITPKQQKILLVFFTILSFIVFTGNAETSIGTQSVLGDVAQDLGFEKSFSTATSVLVFMILGLGIVMYFFGTK